ncbi:hypothetical protein PUR25_01910 [Streptomyces sp. JV181]|nr:hypothetical protein [Streptomyces sp. JV181]
MHERTSTARVYAADHGSTDPYATLPGHDRRTVRRAVARRRRDNCATGAYLITPHSAYGPGGRDSYGPTFSRPDGPWVWEGDVP